MNVKHWAAFLILTLAPFEAYAQGFAGLGASAEGYDLPNPETILAFPDDHGSHDNFRIEWWYLTANLSTSEGTELGAQFTLFRNALAPNTDAKSQAWMAHAALSHPTGHFHAERLARGRFGQAGVNASPFEGWIDEWLVEGSDLSDVSVFAQGTDFSYQLRFEAFGPFIPNGDAGYSIKSEQGLASHYYSQPFYRVSGNITLPSGEFDVAGQGWLDREWSSQPLSETQTGWDWMSLHLGSGEKLMVYALRDSATEGYRVGTFVDTQQRSRSLGPGDISMRPLETEVISGRTIPVTWAVNVPSADIAITVSALFSDSWMPTAVPYWEGPVTVTGSHSGRGYLEMTGYE